MYGLTIAEVISVWLIVHSIDLTCWSVWRFFNFLADQYLRRNGWDEKDDWVPLIDYLPIWRLLKGVDDMPPKTFRRMI